MSNTPHELAEEFPDKVEAMSQLKQSDAHFAKLADEYHEVNRAVHRAESRVTVALRGKPRDARAVELPP